jgi:hypothetical protein
VLVYGSFARGTQTPASDFDVLFVIDDPEAARLSLSFVLNGRPCDFWPVGWEFLEAIAEARNGRPWGMAASMLVDAKVLHARSRSDERRLETLKQHVQDFAASTDAQVEAEAAVASGFADVIHHLGAVHAGIARDDIVGARIAAQRLVAATVNVVAVKERRYFTSARGAYVEQASRMRSAPAGLTELCDRVFDSSAGLALASAVDALVTALSETLSDRDGAGPAAPNAVEPSALVNSYAEVREHCQKVVTAAQAGDTRRAQSEAIGVQGEVAMLLHRYAGNAEVREWDRWDDVLDTYVESGFPDLIGPAVKGDLEALADNARVLEAKFHSLLQSEGVADNSFESLAELDSALRGLREKRCC